MKEGMKLGMKARIARNAEKDLLVTEARSPTAAFPISTS